MKLSDSVNKIKGVGEKTSAMFNKVGVFSLWDLLLYVPRDFIRYPEITKAEKIEYGMTVAVAVTVQSEPSLVHASRLSILSCNAGDDTGMVRLVWFNMPYIKKTLKAGMTRVFYGKVGLYRNSLVLEHPKIYTREEYEKMQGVLEPVYPVTHGLTSSRVQKTIQLVLDEALPVKDYLPEREAERLGVMPLSDAIRMMHSSVSEKDMRIARKRIAFDEYLSFLLSVRSMKEENLQSKNSFPMNESGAAKLIIDKLPYKLTNAQLKTYREICDDMTGARAMNRLVQGDVGSGKTIVALLAMVTAAEHGYQSAMMAPTEVLAAQHASKIRAMLEEYGLDYGVELLSGSLTAKQKR